MSPIQITIIIVGAFLVFITLRLFYKEQLSLRQTISWNALWIVLGILTVYVDKLGIISKITGIDRPVDLFVYLAIIVLFIYNYKLNLKIETQNRELTKIVRSNAIKNSKK